MSRPATDLVLPGGFKQFLHGDLRVTFRLASQPDLIAHDLFEHCGVISGGAVGTRCSTQDRRKT